MLVRSIALLAALITGAVGVIPSVSWHRCLWTHERMAPEHECDKTDSSVPTVTAPCCEQVAALALETRANNAAPEKTLSAPTVVALLSFVVLVDSGHTLAGIRLAAHPRGRPPGDQLERFSSILRI